jgi:hypothetical protein
MLNRVTIWHRTSHTPPKNACNILHHTTPVQSTRHCTRRRIQVHPLMLLLQALSPAGPSMLKASGGQHWPMRMTHRSDHHGRTTTGSRHVAALRVPRRGGACNSRPKRCQRHPGILEICARKPLPWRSACPPHLAQRWCAWPLDPSSPTRAKWTLAKKRVVPTRPASCSVEVAAA